MEELRKRHREAMRAQGQPVYVQPGKRERRRAAKRANGHGRTDYEIAVVAFNRAHNPNPAQRFYGAMLGWWRRAA